jgi:hypothetical protein
MLQSFLASFACLWVAAVCRHVLLSPQTRSHIPLFSQRRQSLPLYHLINGGVFTGLARPGRGSMRSLPKTFVASPT